MRFPKQAALSILFLLALGSAAAQTPHPGADPGSPENPKGDKWFGKKEKKPDKLRSVNGVVLDEGGDLVEGAVVKLKDAKTLEIRSFITLEDGSFRFHGLSTENDYELKASHEGKESRTRRLTVFDSRKKATMNLQLENDEKS